MNDERISELARAAGFENGHQDRNGNSLSNELERFAELIMRECADYAFSDDRERAAMLRHFGIEGSEGDSACPLCGEDSGTTCGIPGCQY